MLGSTALELLLNEKRVDVRSRLFWNVEWREGKVEDCKGNEKMDVG
jgi:hypothetical protein